MNKPDLAAVRCLRAVYQLDQNEELLPGDSTALSAITRECALAETRMLCQAILETDAVVNSLSMSMTKSPSWKHIVKYAHTVLTKLDS